MWKITYVWWVTKIIEYLATITMLWRKKNRFRHIELDYSNIKDLTSDLVNNVNLINDGKIGFVELQRKRSAFTSWINNLMRNFIIPFLRNGPQSPAVLELLFLAASGTATEQWVLKISGFKQASIGNWTLERITRDHCLLTLESPNQRVNYRRSNLML